VSLPVEGVRWIVREETRWQGAERGGRPVAGGKSRKVHEQVKTLQIMVDGKWYDVPEVFEERKP
jgi:hypothetical protein